MADINPLLQLIQGFAEANAGNQNKATTAVNESEQAGQEAIAATQRANDLQARVDEQKNKAALQAQVETQAFKKLSGGDITDPNSLIAQLTQDYAEQERNRMQTAAKIGEMDSVGLTDNPLQWLVNKFTIDGEIDKHNFHAVQANLDKAGITAIQSGIQEQNKVALVTADALTKESVADSTQALVERGKAQVAALRAANAAQNMDMLSKLQQGQLHEVQMANTAVSAKMQQEQAGRDSARIAMEAQRLQMEKLNSEQTLSIRKEELAQHKIDSARAEQRFEFEKQKMPLELDQMRQQLKTTANADRRAEINTALGMRTYLNNLDQQKIENARADKRDALALRSQNFQEYSWLEGQNFRDAQLKALETTLNDKQLEEEAKQSMVDTVNVGIAKVTGKMGTLNTKTIQLAMKTPENAQMVSIALQAGLKMNEDGSVGTNSLGNSAGDAYVNLRKANADQYWGTQLQNPVYAAMKEAQFLNADKLAEEADPKKREALLVATVDANIAARVKDSRKNAEAKTSLYKPQSLAAIIDAVPEMKDTALFAAVLKPMLEAKITDISIKSLDAHVNAAIKKGLIAEPLAIREVSKLYSASAAVNNIANRLAELGVPPQTSYAVPTELRGGFFNKTITLDVTKPEQYAKYRYYARSLGQDLLDTNIPNTVLGSDIPVLREMLKGTK